MLHNTFSRPAYAGFGLALLALMPSAASAWSRPIDGAKPSDAVIQRTSSNDAGQYWAIGRSGIPSVLLRYDAAAAPAAVVAGAPATVGATHTTPQGDLVAVLYDQSLLSNCRVVKYASNGTLRWTQPFGTCSFGPPIDTRIWPVADGSFQVRLASRLIRFGGDGRILDNLATAAIDGTVEAVDPRDGSMYAVNPGSPGFSPALAAYDRKGVQRWHKTLEAPVRVTVASDGSLRVAGIQRGLFVASYGADGAARWSTVVDAAGSPGGYGNLKAPIVDAAGASWITQGTDVAAAKLDADGRVLWQKRRGELGVGATAEESDARLGPNGDLALAHGDRVNLLDASGRVRYGTSVTATGFTPIASIASFDSAGATVLLLRDATLRNGVLKRLGADGAELAPPSTADVVKTPANAQRAVLRDGSIAVWTNGANGSRELLRVDEDGSLLWRQSTPGTWSSANGSVNFGAVAAIDGRVCTLDALLRDDKRDHVLACYRTDDGTRLWSRSVREGSTNADAGVARMYIAADGSISAWYSYGGRTGGNASDDVGFVRVDRDGNVVASKTFTASLLVNAATPNVPFALVGTRDGVLALDADAAELYRFNPTYSLTAAVHSAGFAADGSVVVLVVSAASQDGLAVRYDTTGREVWRKSFNATIYDFEPPVLDGDAVYVAACCVPGAKAQVTRLSLARGTVTWQRDLQLSPFSQYGPVAVALTNDRSGVVAVRASRRFVDIDVLEARSGGVRTSRREACRSDACTTSVPLLANGDLLHVLDVGVYGGSSLIAWEVPAGNRAPIRIDQIGIAGAWWAPYSNGEGFVLDYLPASRTFFMPWFTFSPDGANEPSAHRWYVIQGTVPENATSVDLPITRSVGGAFDDGPVVQAQTVGTATLRFDDCSNGRLTYAFNPGVNDGISGTISLARLGPATETCRLANGTTRPGDGARPPENGFDARMSGSWFEEATSGQGLQFVIQPGGLYFVPWFTFTPRDTGTDAPRPSQQRWFTLQGSLANARNGTIEAPIVQTIGGAFDGRPTNNMTIVGTSKLTMHGCDRATLEYRFDDNDLAERLRGRSGSIDLVKIGGCGPQ